MRHRDLYQTLEDRDNPDEIENHGAYLCDSKNAWLGDGYYLWDTFIELAHWWGDVAYKKHNKDYVICHTACDGDLKGVYDLVGHPELYKEIKHVVNLLRESQNVDEVFFSEVVEYLKEFGDFENEYHAIRILPMDSHKSDAFVRFVKTKKSYIDLYPPIQFCFFNKKHFTQEFRIVYPPMYCEESAM